MPFKSKEAQRLSAKKHYYLHKEDMITRAKRFTQKARERNRNYINSYLEQHPCVDCGEKDIIVLDFDHVFGKKVDNISTGINLAWSINKLQKEIDKCEVRCANCHRRITHQRRKTK